MMTRPSGTDLTRAGPGGKPRARTLVLKFGGTSVGSVRRIRRAARRISYHIARGRQVVVVVSAAGPSTDILLAHVSAVAPARNGGAAARSREVDRLLATGEDRSAALLSAALWSRGVAARSLRGGEAGIRAEGAFGGGSIRHVATARLRRLLESGVTPVVAGFQGQRSDGEIVTLGRGGSDTTAVAIAAALDADCHIITDVTAVHDRDPRVHADAQPLPRLTHAALVALVERGAQVVHPSAASLAAFAEVPLSVYHHAAPPCAPGGTLIESAPVPEFHDFATAAGGAA
jgi:aspartate kinase